MRRPVRPATYGLLWGMSVGALAICLCVTLLATSSLAQTPSQRTAQMDEQAADLGAVYRERLARARLREAVARVGLGIAPRPPVWVDSPGDSILFHLLALQEKPLPNRPQTVAEATFSIETWRVVPPEQRAEFEPTFRNVAWTFLGANTLSPLDTTKTSHLRAALQARFGAPSLTVVEQVTEWGIAPDTTADADLIQFEYWFVVNDYIPLVVSDVGGPFDRGLIIATDYRYAERLHAVRETFLGPALLEQRGAAYADYYFERSGATWHRTSFNGWRTITTPIPPPNLDEGRPYARAGRR